MFLLLVYMYPHLIRLVCACFYRCCSGF